MNTNTKVSAKAEKNQQKRDSIASAQMVLDAQMAASRIEYLLIRMSEKGFL